MKGLSEMKKGGQGIRYEKVIPRYISTGLSAEHFPYSCVNRFNFC
jgi:hypothetical protein